MSDTQRPNSVSRRSFLVAAGVAGAAIAVGVAPRRAGAEELRLKGLKIDELSGRGTLRTLPIYVADSSDRGVTTRVITSDKETIPVGVTASAAYLVGICPSVSQGVAFWGDQPSYKRDRGDQLYIGRSIGDAEFVYTDGTSDTVPLVIGSTTWFSGYAVDAYPEPLKSRPDVHAAFNNALLVRRASEPPITVPGAKAWRTESRSSADGTTAVFLSTWPAGETAVGTLRSKEFSAPSTLSFWLAGQNGVGRSMRKTNFVQLVDAASGDVYARTYAPGSDIGELEQWDLSDVAGKQVVLELVDGDDSLNGFAWMAFGRPSPKVVDMPTEAGGPVPASWTESGTVVRRPAAPIELPRKAWRAESDTGADGTTAVFLSTRPAGEAAVGTLRSKEFDAPSALSFWLAGQNGVGSPSRKTNFVQLVDATTGNMYARTYVPGNDTAQLEQWDLSDVAGKQVALELVDGDGSDSWAWMAFGRPDPAVVAMPTQAGGPVPASWTESHAQPVSVTDMKYLTQFLGVALPNKKLQSIVLHDNSTIGRPVLLGVTLATNDSGPQLVDFGDVTVDPADAEPGVDAGSGWQGQKATAASAAALYTSDADLPKSPPVVALPSGVDGTTLTFHGGEPYATMLTNYWSVNLAGMDAKFDPATGNFHESSRDAANYGSYQGIGTWDARGANYATAFGRSAEEFAILALRNTVNPRRATSFVDFVDSWLYFFRTNHDPAQGPSNNNLDVTAYPKDAPPHWTFTINPPTVSPSANEIPGVEEMSGHGGVMMARWEAWRRAGRPTGDWLTAPRDAVYGKSRWDATRDAAEFITWLLDYTGRDVMWEEGEVTGYGFGRVPPGMGDPAPPDEKKKQYAKANMYPPYASYQCMIALQTSAEIADAIGEHSLADKWRSTRARLHDGMLAELTVPSTYGPAWNPSTAWPSYAVCLAQAWLSRTLSRLDPWADDPKMSTISLATLRRELARLPDHADVLGFGYGQGILTQAALALDEMDHASKLVVNLAKLGYDKNMDFVDNSSGIDWRNMQWIFPEGVNLLPTGQWHRIGDLGNGANQGEAQRAVEWMAGIDNYDPAHLRLLPRVPEPLTGLDVHNAPVLVPDGPGLSTAKLEYQYRPAGSMRLTVDKMLPSVDIRLGPYENRGLAEQVTYTINVKDAADVSVVQSGHFHGRDAWWVWARNLSNVQNLDLHWQTPQNS